MGVIVDVIYSYAIINTSGSSPKRSLKLCRVNVMINDRNNINVHLLYVTINAVKQRVKDELKLPFIDLDNDWPNTVIFSGTNNYHYWFYDVVKWSHIYLHEVICTKDNLELVVDKDYKFDTMGLLIQHIANVINTTEDWQ